MRKPKNHEAKLAVAQVYWNADQAYKNAEAKRGRARDLALVAIAKGESIGPVHSELGVTWLTHGEKERVEMDALDLWRMPAIGDEMATVTEFMALMTVNTAALKHAYPKIYAKMLKHKSTKRTTHSCLTWSMKPPRAKR